MGSQLGQWIVVEPAQRVLSIGQRLYRGQSLRSLVDGPHRDHLVKAAEKALKGEHVRLQTRANGTPVVIHGEPIVGPNGTAHGALCFAAGPDDEPHDNQRPNVGAWEWDLDGFRTRWSRALYSVYGLPEPEEVAGWSFQAPQWFDLLEPGAYPRMMELLARLRAEKPGASDLMFASFRLLHDDRQLRLAGRADPGPQVGHRFFRGLTMRINDYLAPEEDQENLRLFADVFLALSSEPMAVVHIDDGRINLRNRAWHQLGLDVPDYEDEFLSLIHPDERAKVAKFLLAAPRHVREERSPITSRVRISGVWTTVGLNAMAVRFTAQGGAGVVDQVMVRLDP